MNPREIALRYMEIVYQGKDFDELYTIFSPDLRFKGSLHQYNSAEEYINALKNDPPKGFQYQMIEIFEKESSVCLIYGFSKPGIKVPMAQMFRLKDNRLQEIELIFDSIKFLQ